MPAFTYRTLGELREELRARLGFAAAGSSAGASNAIVDSFLTSAQKLIYRLQDWKKLRAYEDVTLGASQNLIDYPADANPDRILSLSYLFSGRWIDLREGIETAMWDTMEDENRPVRYELQDQILFWPKADAIYTVKIWYIKELARFTQDNDRASIDDDLIFLHALAHAKAHYKQPDAAVYQDQWATMLAKISGSSIGSNAVFRRRGMDTMPEPKPVVV